METNQCGGELCESKPLDKGTTPSNKSWSYLTNTTNAIFGNTCLVALYWLATLFTTSSLTDHEVVNCESFEGVGMVLGLFLMASTDYITKMVEGEAHAMRTVAKECANIL